MNFWFDTKDALLCPVSRPTPIANYYQAILAAHRNTSHVCNYNTIFLGRQKRCDHWQLGQVRTSTRVAVRVSVRVAIQLELRVPYHDERKPKKVNEEFRSKAKVSDDP